MAGSRFRVPRPPALDTTGELSAAVGLLVVAVLGWQGVITELYLAGSVVALVLLWGGARVHSISRDGVQLAPPRCPVCDEPKGRCLCD
jgi:hypothetical protein